MTLATQSTYISEQDYLNSELETDIKHEYIDGQVYAMAGAHRHHNYLAGDIYTEFNVHLKGKICRPYSSEMKVKVGKNYFYPDVMVDCGEEDQDYYTDHPTIIVEVLSQSTRRYDKTLKKDLYFSIPTLKEYVLVEQDIAEIEVWRRTEGNFWQQNVYYLGDNIYFASIDLNIAVEDIYQRVKNSDVLAWLEQKNTEQSHSQ